MNGIDFKKLIEHFGSVYHSQSYLRGVDSALLFLVFSV